MIDLRIDTLRLDIVVAPGHEHRMGPIAHRAATLLAERASRRLSEVRGAVEMSDVSASSVPLDLDRNTDEQAASAIANAWLESLRVRLGV